MIRRMTYIVAATLLATAAPAVFAATEPTSKQFVKDAIESNLTEIKASELALTKSQDPGVKQFAQRMIDDHKKTITQIETVAARKNIEVPDKADLMGRVELKMLQHKSGADFDKDYLERVNKDHEKAIKLFQEAASSPKVDGELQAVARKTLPTLEQHHHSAMQLASSASDASRR